MKVFLGLSKTVDDNWTNTGMFLEEPAGVLCEFDDGSKAALTHDGRIMRFDKEGRGTWEITGPGSRGRYSLELDAGS